MFGIRPKPNVGSLDTMAGEFEIGYREGEVFTDGTVLQQGEHRGSAQAGLWKVEQREETLDNLAGLLCTSICNAKGNPARLIFRRTEDGFDERSVGFDVRHHHDDVPWRKERVTVEPIENVIVQHLQFTERAMTRVNLDRVLSRMDWFLAC